MASPILQSAGIVLLLIASAAGVVGYFKANVSKSTIELYKEDNEALRLRLSSLEAQAKVDALEIKGLKNAHAYLLQVVTSAEAIAHVQATVDKIAAKVGA